MIVLAYDHGGFELAQEIKKLFACKDLGAQRFDAEDDFPPIVERAVKEVIKSKGIGIIICGSGIGVCIAANRHKGIRAALCHSAEYAKMARLHNDANVLCLGGRYVSVKEAQEIITTFLNTQFLGGKYQKRMAQIDKIL